MVWLTFFRWVVCGKYHSLITYTLHSRDMSTQVQYQKVIVDPKNEAKMVDALLKTNQSFKAVSRTEYYITKKQCSILARKNIPYKKYTLQ